MQEHHNQKRLNSNFQIRSKDQFIQTWLSNIRTSTQCTNYRIFKTTFTPERYLSKLNRNDFINLCKFRVGNSKILVVLGRFSNIIIEDRICPLCNFHNIGDEYHYIFLSVNTLRKKYIPTVYTKNYNSIKLNKLFNTNDPKTLKTLLYSPKKLSIILNNFSVSFIYAILVIQFFFLTFCNILSCNIVYGLYWLYIRLLYNKL